jgi:hypothetical protein
MEVMVSCDIYHLFQGREITPLPATLIAEHTDSDRYVKLFFPIYSIEDLKDTPTSEDFLGRIATCPGNSFPGPALPKMGDCPKSRAFARKVKTSKF